jgi:DNA-binding NtrC family response regulator
MLDTASGLSRGILVVEDDEQLQTALTKVLSQHGYDVTVARDGHEGLEHVERDAPWLVLTDLSLPGKGGMEFLREVRTQGYHMPVVVMTAYGGVDVAVEALKYGATDFRDDGLWWRGCRGGSPEIWGDRFSPKTFSV